MVPGLAAIQNLHKKYAAFATASHLYELVFEHCEIVCEIALECAARIDEPIDTALLRAAALLHDVASYPFFNDQGEADGQGFYPMHGILGAKVLADEGFDPRIGEIVGTHLLLGLSKDEIVNPPSRHWPLPAHDYQPTTIEGELLCYADRFHSKDPMFNSYETLLRRFQENLPKQAEKFETWSKRFGVPDVPALAQKYNQKVR